MPKFKITYTRPAVQRIDIIDTDTPEQAALDLKRKVKHPVEDVVVEAVGEDDSEKSVYDWCSVCELPIWLTDESDTYTMKGSDEASELVVTHLSCLSAPASSPKLKPPHTKKRGGA